MVWQQQQQYLHGRCWSRPSTLLLLLLVLLVLLGAAVEAGTSVEEDHHAGAVWDTTATAAATYDESTKPTRGAAGGRHLRRQVLSSEKKDFAAADRSLSDTATNTTTKQNEFNPSDFSPPAVVSTFLGSEDFVNQSPVDQVSDIALLPIQIAFVLPVAFLWSALFYFVVSL